MSTIRTQFLLSVLMIVPALGLPGPAAAEPAFVLIGDLPGGENRSYALGISPDGSVVVGNSDAASGFEGFRWENGVMAPLRNPGSDIIPLTAFDASRGGRVVVGRAHAPGKTEAYRWIDGVMTTLGPGTYQAMRVSEDGRVVAGTIPADRSGLFVVDPVDHFRWEDGQVTHILGGFTSNEMVSLSADGSVQGGEGMGSADEMGAVWTQAFLWQDDVTTPLPGFGEGLYPTFPQPWMSGVVALSSDGASMVVDMFLWGGPPTWITRCTGQCWGRLGEVETFDHPQGYDVHPQDGNWDLSVIVGHHWIPVPQAPDVRRAMVYDDVNGIRDLRSVIENDYGIDLSQWELVEATAVSEDGNVVVGFGTHATLGTQAWLFDSDGGLSPSLPPPPPAPAPGLSWAGRALLVLLVTMTAVLSLVAALRYRRAG